MFEALFPTAPASPTNDPYSLVPPVPNVVGGATNVTFPDWDNPNGRVPVDLTSLTGTTLVLIIAGQSLSTNCADGIYTPTNTGHVLNFSITNGGLYQAKDPLLGCTGYHPNLPGNPWPTGHWGSRLGDKLINAGTANNVILVPIGVGGSNILDWQVGGGNNPRYVVTARRLAAAGLTPNALLFEQGESNNNGTTQSAYAAGLSSMIGTVQGIWPTMPIFVAIASWINGITSSAVQAAQAAAVNHAAGVWAGANADSLGNSYRQSDQTHWNNATGTDAIAGLWQASLHAYGTPF
jgi:hypothetical protein